MPTLTIDLQDDGPPPVYLLGGTLDTASRVRIREVLRPLVAGGVPSLVLDLTWLQYLDRHGVQELTDLAAAAPGRIVLRNVQGLAKVELESSRVLSSVPNLRVETRLGPLQDAYLSERSAARRRSSAHRATPAAVRRITPRPGGEPVEHRAPDARPA